MNSISQLVKEETDRDQLKMLMSGHRSQEFVTFQEPMHHNGTNNYSALAAQKSRNLMHESSPSSSRGTKVMINFRGQKYSMRLN